MSIDIFGFRAMWSPYYLLVLLGVLGLYFLLMGPLRSRFSGNAPASVKNISLFVSGIILLYICKGSPLDLMGHLTFSAHMTQMALLYLVVPPLLILGLPVWLLRAIVNISIIKPIMKVLTMPLIAIILFNGLFSFYHIPMIFDVVKTSVALHAFTTTVLFITAVMMWWPLVNPLPEMPTLNGLKKVGYVFADGILLTPACALIIFADTSLYATYTDLSAWTTALELCVPQSMLASIDLSGPQMFNTLPVIDDQRLGGVIMKIIQEIVYGVILTIVFFEWVRKERENEEELDSRLMNPQTIE